MYIIIRHARPRRPVGRVLFFFSILPLSSRRVRNGRRRISLGFSKTTSRSHEMHTARSGIRIAERSSHTNQSGLAGRKRSPELRCVGECVPRLPGSHRVPVVLLGVGLKITIFLKIRFFFLFYVV